MTTLKEVLRILIVEANPKNVAEWRTLFLGLCWVILFASSCLF